MTTSEIPYRQYAIRPVECVTAAWELVKKQYWLFVGMCVVAMLIGSAVPAGILLGPMMCGMYFTFFKLRRNEPVEFAMLFKGFDFFGPSLIATLLHIAPIMAFVIAMYVFFYVSLIVSVIAQGDNPNPGAMLGVFAMLMLFFIVVVLVIILISVGFTFAYPLIVDRRMKGFDAVKLSFKAAMANFWGLLGMVLLTSVLNLAGMMVCYVGMFLALPITYGAIAVAYERVFGLAHLSEASTLPPPPPSFN